MVALGEAQYGTWYAAIYGHSLGGLAGYVQILLGYGQVVFYSLGQRRLWPTEKK
ncbi:MAG: hypothetical protein ABIK12_16770 [Pseudomonadota bacterium]